MDKPKRKGRPLLLAAAGVAFVSFANCEPKYEPVGNLRGPDPGMPVSLDAGAPNDDNDASTPIATQADAGPPIRSAH
jgi:hypothetical protein